VIGGGSAGGHLVWLATFLPDEPKPAPIELQGVYLTVHGVTAAYGPPDLEALYYHADQHLTMRSRPGQPKNVDSGQKVKGEK
jgi:hypothetical protein